MQSLIKYRYLITKFSIFCHYQATNQKQAWKNSISENTHRFIKHSKFHFNQLNLTISLPISKIKAFGIIRYI